MICGPVLEGDGWGGRQNRKFGDLYKGPDIVRVIKSKRLRWLSHIQYRNWNTIIKMGREMTWSETIREAENTLEQPSRKLGVDLDGRD